MTYSGLRLLGVPVVPISTPPCLDPSLHLAAVLHFPASPEATLFCLKWIGRIWVKSLKTQRYLGKEGSNTASRTPPAPGSRGWPPSRFSAASPTKDRGGYVRLKKEGSKRGTTLIGFAYTRIRWYALISVGVCIA